MVSVDRIMHRLLMGTVLGGMLGELLIRMGHLWLEAIEGDEDNGGKGRGRRGALLYTFANKIHSCG
jgi:hypothetical protein